MSPKKPLHEMDSRVYPPITERDLDRMVDTYVEDFLEQRHLSEVPIQTEDVWFEDDQPGGIGA